MRSALARDLPRNRRRPEGKPRGARGATERRRSDLNVISHSPTGKLTPSLLLLQHSSPC